MVRKLYQVAALTLAIGSRPGFAQVDADEFDFLEEWETLSDAFRLGEVKLTGRGLPPGYDTETSKATENGLFKVSVSPAKKPPPFNRIHTWWVRIETPAGKPATGAALKFYGGMPLHNHGFPTKPRFTGEVRPGVYSLEGVKFSMTGWWAIAVGITRNGKRDRVGFNLIIEP